MPSKLRDRIRMGCNVMEMFECERPLPERRIDRLGIKGNLAGWICTGSHRNV